MSKDKNYTLSDFDEYIRQGEPDRQQKARNWQTAIGLQAVDGLHTSDYLHELARQNIEGQINSEQVQDLLKSYYQSKTNRLPDEELTEEADRVSANINRILQTRTLAFNTNGYVSLHRQIFQGVFKFAGQIRDYDITKKEWVLRGDTVIYLNYHDLRAALDYDIRQEREFDYRGLDINQTISHIARFVADLWQIHAFGEGNTRTTAVFTIQYLRSIGFNINNDLFKEHSWYFRNALVRANYKNAQRGIMYNYSYLEKFFRNLLSGEKNELKNRTMVIDAPDDWQEMNKLSEQEPDKYRTSTEQVPSKSGMVDVNIQRLIEVIGYGAKSVKEMLSGLQLKHRPTFMENYLDPALKNGLVCMLYPESPKHPRQKYKLTVKGLVIFNELQPKK